MKVYAKGQINLNGIDENLAKRRALEDALYFASMKAGAEVKGFSSIDEETNLNENTKNKQFTNVVSLKTDKSDMDDLDLNKILSINKLNPK